MEGELKSGSPEVRSWGLAWAARVLAGLEEDIEPESLIAESRQLDDQPETSIAEAFVFSREGDKAQALKTLAEIDTPQAKSAALIVVSRHDGLDGALQWFAESGLEAGSLDPEGRHILLVANMETNNWSDAQSIAEQIPDEELEQNPILLHDCARVFLGAASPSEFRSFVCQQIPYFELQNFRFSSDADAINLRRKAQSLFARAASSQRSFGCTKIAENNEEYAIWLQLRDENSRESGLDTLRRRLRDKGDALRFTYIAVQFGIKLDLAAVEREIDRQRALRGGENFQTSIARFAIALTGKDEKEVAEYINKYRDDLVENLGPDLVFFREIEMWCRAGLVHEAKTGFAAAQAAGVSGEQIESCRRLIDEAEGQDPIAGRKLVYENSGALNDLLNLRDLLFENEVWEELVEYGRAAFEQTGDFRDAEILLDALSKCSMDNEVLSFLDTHSEVLDHSKMARLVRCLAYYRLGKLTDARSQLEVIGVGDPSENVRRLRLNIALCMGDWDELLAIVADGINAAEQLTSQELVQIAYLALQIQAPGAKVLLKGAVEKAPDDPNVLASAYFLASNAGWEDDPEVFQWLNRAAELSGPQGPIYPASLEEIVERQPAWDRHERDISKSLSEGAIPLFIGAKALNRSLVEMVLLPATANPNERDPRRRAIIPAFSGKRSRISADLRGTVGVDATSLLTLAWLGDLGKLRAHAERLVIPHSTMTWLFEEKQKATFHQPSRIKYAEEIRNLIASKKLDTLVPTTVVDTELVQQVGEDLSRLICEARANETTTGTQSVVVRSAPVHRIGSLLSEEADLSAHADIICGCQNVVRTLKSLGKITSKQESDALAYLRLHEREWPTDLTLEEGANLYLDDLSTRYLATADIIGVLKDSGFNPILCPSTIREANQLISYNHTANQMMDVIDNVQQFLKKGIKSGNVVVDSQQTHDQDDPETQASTHPTLTTIHMSSNCDSIIVDDRFINQHETATHNTKTCKLFTTVDLLDALLEAKEISYEEWVDRRTRLRRAQFLFVPIDEDELFFLIDAATVRDTKVQETVELRAFRENIQRARMTEYLQLPAEEKWLQKMLISGLRTIRRLWEGLGATDITRTKSQWILDLVEPQGWLQAMDEPRKTALIQNGRATYVAAILMPPTDADEETKGAYSEWVDEMLVQPMKKYNPELYGLLVEIEKNYTKEFIKNLIDEVEKDNGD